ncbi:MAG: recombinase family protein [Clostridiales bacterium]|nr:recombinase family protein [Eubacteriales bacterium]MDH7566836.1 recombinase family protein [Clostridiales bacterium]
MANMIKAAAYARYSSDNQTDASIDAQLRAIEEYAAKNNILIVKTYIDRAKTATTDNRPEFQQMVNDCKYDLFSAVIVHKLDRFSRDRYDSAFYKRQLKKKGIRLISVLKNLDDSPESVIMESVLEGMAEYYSRNLAREVMKGMKEKALLCRHTGGQPPLGYDVDPETKKYIINEYEAEIVKAIFKMYLDGFGYPAMVEQLNSKGYKTKLGQAFGKNSIHDILANEKYFGVYIYNKSASKNEDGKRNSHKTKDNDLIIRIPGGMPAIVSTEDFQKVQYKMDQNKKRASAYRAKEMYLLSGLIYCGECGHAMIGNVKYSGRNKLKYVTYRCGERDRTKFCKNKEIRREYIEEYVLQQLEEKIFNEKNIPLLVEKLNKFQNNKNDEAKQKIRALTEKIKQVDIQIKNVLAMIRSGCTSRILAEDLENLEKEKTELELQLRQLNNKQNENTIDEKTLSKIFSSFRQFIKDRNTQEVKKFIHQYVEKVLVFEDHVKVVFKLYIVVATFGKLGEYRCHVLFHIMLIILIILIQAGLKPLFIAFRTDLIFDQAAQ